jgi:hypothetical protein
MSVKMRAAQRNKAVALAQHARVDADPLDDPVGIAANQPRLTKFRHLF